MKPRTLISSLPFFFIVILIHLGCETKDPKSQVLTKEKIRTVILTDMTHDDGNSLIRYLYYASNFDLEAIIVTNQLPDFRHDETGPWDKVTSILNAYKKELPQLQKHDPDLPSYQELIDVTKQGRGALPIIWLTNTLEFSDHIADRYVTTSWDSVYFHDWIGEGMTPHQEPKDSEGSNLLVEVFEKDDDRPIYVQAWGGTLTFVQAMHRFREKHGEEKFRQLLPKIHLYGILFQDISFEFFADFLKLQEETCADFGTAIPTYGQEPVALGKVLYDNGHFWHYVWSRDPDWQKPIVPQDVNGHGPMSEMYDNGGEGDSPSYFYLLSSVFGLNDPLEPTQGSWGSLFKPMSNEFPENYYSTCDVPQEELTRWDKAVSNNFKNRLLWSVKEPGEVNREPQALIEGYPATQIIKLIVAPGEKISLDASVSSDPDGDELTFNWFRYDLADTYTGNFELADPFRHNQHFTVPADIADTNIHLVLEVKDNGTPSLTTYRRIIIETQK